MLMKIDLGNRDVKSSSSEPEWPSFSIVLETENSANADLQGLRQAIAALEQQDLAPTSANEVLLIDSGDAPAEVLQTLVQHYPWLTILPTPATTTYYQAKMLGAARCSGEIVVYYDSDCLYPSHWLRTMLSAFAQCPDRQVVAGETTTDGRGIYGTAMALTYIFPPFSQQTALTPTPHYFLNNVAFRRNFLLKHPIPIDLPFYRGHCAIHAHQLRHAGYTLWRQPCAQAKHAPPNGLTHFFWRFLLIGYDYYWQKQLLRSEASDRRERTDPVMAGWRGKWQVFNQRVVGMLRQNPWHGLYLPFALPLVIASVALIYGGYVITALKPKYLLEVYDRYGG